MHRGGSTQPEHDRQFEIDTRCDSTGCKGRIWANSGVARLGRHPRIASIIVVSVFCFNSRATGWLAELQRWANCISQSGPKSATSKNSSHCRKSRHVRLIFRPRASKPLTDASCTTAEWQVFADLTKYAFAHLRPRFHTTHAGNRLEQAPPGSRARFAAYTGCSTTSTFYDKATSHREEARQANPQLPRSRSTSIRSRKPTEELSALTRPPAKLPLARDPGEQLHPLPLRADRFTGHPRRIVREFDNPLSRNARRSHSIRRGCPRRNES